MRSIQKITEIITKVFTFVACMYLLYILFACAVQVFSRYVLNSSFGWTEETARYAFADMGLLGIPVALRKNMHVSVDILENKLAGRAKLIQKLVLYFGEALIALIFVVKGMQLFLGVKGIFSPAVRIPMQIVYYAIPLCGLCSLWMIFVGVLETLQMLREEGGK